MNARWLLLGVALTIPSLVLGADVYKWIDDQGVVHYGAQPPLGAETVRLKVSSGGGSSASPPKQADEGGDSDTEAAPEAEAGADEQAEVDPEEAARVCADARRNLQTLESYGRIRERDAEGNVTVLTDEQKQARIEQAEELIETYCK